ncbi:MAG: DUF616 domain-containing protein [Spirochaetales bacterium]|nr:DUF616 domain-containing protein [Spirochaetales bacterium]
MKLVVYTAIFGNYDKLKELKFNKKNIDYICFTNEKSLKSKTWEIRFIEPNIQKENNSTILNRDIKINCNKYLKDYDKSIYIDGNIQVLNDLEDLFKYVENCPMAALKHRTRECIYDEAYECYRINKSGIEIINQVEKYKLEGFPSKFGMSENCILIRNHKNPEIDLISKAWWDEFQSGVKRDQISLPYLKWKCSFNIKQLDFNPREPNGYLRWRQHDIKYKKFKKIWYNTKSWINGKQWRIEIKNVKAKNYNNDSNL